MNGSDDPLAARLARLFAEADPVPEAVLAAARAGLGWRNLDAEVASLVADSLWDAGAVRGDAARLLTFEAGELTIEVEVSDVGGRLRVLGQVVPPRAVEVRVEQPGGGVLVTADEWGRFAVPDLPTGPTRFVCGDPAVGTEWTVL